MDKRVIGELINLGPEFWDRDRRQSGLEIDRKRGQNIPANSRVIDRTTGTSGVVSHKSTDLRCASYKSPRSVYRLGMRFVQSLANYRGEVRRNRLIRATYHLHWAVETPDAPRVLEWFVPLQGVARDQENALRQVVEDARAKGVTVRVYRVR